MTNIKLIATGVILLITSIVTFMLFEVTKIKGNQAGIMETWNDGVIDKVFPPKTHFLFPGFAKEIITYDMSQQVTALDDFRVQSQEGQDLKIDATLQWRRDQTKLVSQHKTVRDQIEVKVIHPIMMRIIKDHATAQKAINVYSGNGLVALQASIQKALSDPNGELSEKGVLIENFVIRHIDLDPKYIEEIKGRQIATQRQLRAVEEQKAAEAEALVAKSKAQADLNKAVVEAERDKQVKVLAAEASNEQTILSAKAEQQKAILSAEGDKQRQVLAAEGKKAEAEGVLAMGKAEAEAQKLKLQSYAVSGADAFVKVEVAKSLAQAFQNIKGYLPEKMNISVLAGDYDKAVDAITGNTIVPVPVK